MADPETEGLRSTFPSYMAEGERLYLCGEFAKAAHSFSNALHLQNGDKNCLVARSKCFLKMGELEKSLADAEASLQGDPTFCKVTVRGILQKAETLYTMGDFEFALVFYHRGYKLRPDREFKVGIQKAQEAINNSVGSPSSIKLENKGDLSFLSKQAESMQAQQKPHPVRQLVHHPKRESKRKGSLKSEKIIRQLLGELYVTIHIIVTNKLTYFNLSVRTGKEHRLWKGRLTDLPDAKSRALDNIGRVFARVGKFQQAIDTWEEKIPLAKTTLEKTWLFHEIGRCYLELDQAWQAQNYGEKSQQCAEEEGDIEWQLNASVLVAQAQVKLRDFESAVNNFEKALEKAKLVHNNQAQQAIINVSLSPAGPALGVGGPRGPQPQIFITPQPQEDATVLDSITVMAKEKETMRRMRDEPEKVMKQWEREQMESEKETEGDLSKETLGSTASGPEEHTQRGEVEKASPSRRKGPAAMEGGPGDVAKGQSGEAGRKLTEVSREETREIYRRPSELDQNLSEESSTRESEGLEKTLSEIGRRGSEALGKTESGEIREPEITENSEKMDKDEKEDE
ncbi:hypothetical protein E2I00_019163 [Balaenoptera physalus]|uniref:Outer dynein arm-docking complex subunit 4 n=1 Tax=Balaenoptera physalus TaxID=9770 RepID=A0A643CC63_BALPH|nr:hypothetical protein E2I00_019163 [Balaenoptera physalus]